MTRDSFLHSLDRRPYLGPAAALLLGGVASLLRGVDTNWDLRNYHFYNPWAWLHGRLYWDYAPAQIQSYHNPLPDLPFFALVEAQVPAFVVTFLMGLPFGVAVYFFYRIARFALDGLKVERPAPALAAIGIVGLTGAAGLSQIGSTMNEWTTSAFVLAALFLALRAECNAHPLEPWTLGFAGALCGAATGLKLTAAIYPAALACALVVRHRRRPGVGRAAAVFLVAVTLGFVLTYGYWGMILWERFQNPFFPYFNGVFHSEYWDPRSFIDTKFRPATLTGWIALPFGFLARNRLASEADLRDPRLALLLVVSAALAVSVVRESRAGGESFLATLRQRMPPVVRLLSVFAAASYVVWLVAFTIYRYTIPLELTASLLLVLALHTAFRGAKRRDAWVVGASLLIAAITVPPYWGRSRVHLGPYFDVSVPPIAADSLVLTMTGQPFAYLVPFLDPRARVIAPASNFTGPGYDNRLQREMAALIAAHTGPMYAIRYLGSSDALEEATMAAYHLRRDDAGCRPIRSNVEGGRIVGLCPLRREPGR